MGAAVANTLGLIKVRFAAEATAEAAINAASIAGEETEAQTQKFAYQFVHTEKNKAEENKKQKNTKTQKPKRGKWRKKLKIARGRDRNEAREQKS